MKSMKIRSMLGMFSASQIVRYSIKRHVAVGAGSVSRHGNAASSGYITMADPLRETLQGRGGAATEAHSRLGKTTILVSYAG